ncbi:Protein required for ethanol metabolism [Claviceps citrina]|nr:Protein required for ethanol metabolism [Claviceps citrina]
MGPPDGAPPDEAPDWQTPTPRLSTQSRVKSQVLRKTDAVRPDRLVLGAATELEQRALKPAAWLTPSPRYNARLAARPLLTQSVTTAVLFATGDVTAQQVVEGRGLGGHDLTRTGRMALYGGCVFGPVATTWFGFLARRVRFRSSPRVETLARVACDQLLFAPVAIGAFLGSMAAMEGTSPAERLERTWWAALRANWMVWPAVQTVNFALLPLQYRLLFANVVSVGWNSYLSWVNSR